MVSRSPTTCRTVPATFTVSLIQEDSQVTFACMQQGVRTCGETTVPC